MLKRGIKGRGGIIDNFMLGGGTSDIRVVSNSCVNGVPTYANLYTTPQDIVAKNLTINAILLPTAYFSGSGFYCLYKIQVSGKITIGIGGEINCMGEIPAGGGSWNSQSGCTGYLGSFQSGSGVYQSTCGGSGSGGTGSTGATGAAGSPDGTRPNATFTYFGGSGGAGVAFGAGTPGPGGYCIGDSVIVSGVSGPSVVNDFAPSIYQDGIVYSNLDGSNGSYPANGYFLKPYHICGGGGGGGSCGGIAGVGGGAAGGGVCFIKCDVLELGSSGFNINCRGGYGTGAAGGGGFVCICCSQIIWSNSGVISVAGGTGAGNSTTNGKPGKILLFTNDVVAAWDTARDPAFSGVLTKEDYDAAVLAYNS